MLPAVALLELAYLDKKLTLRETIGLSLLMQGSAFAIFDGDKQKNIFMSSNGITSAVIAVGATSCQIVFLKVLQRTHAKSDDLLATLSLSSAGLMLILFPFIDSKLAGMDVGSTIRALAHYGGLEWTLIAVSCAAAAGTNLSQFVIVDMLTPLTFQILSQLKTLGIFFAGFCLGEYVGPLRQVGVLLGVLGSVLYSFICLQGCGLHSLGYLVAPMSWRKSCVCLLAVIFAIFTESFLLMHHHSHNVKSIKNVSSEIDSVQYSKASCIGFSGPLRPNNSHFARQDDRSEAYALRSCKLSSVCVTKEARRLEYFSDLQHGGGLAREAQDLLVGGPIASLTATVLNKKENIAHQEPIFLDVHDAEWPQSATMILEPTVLFRSVNSNNFGHIMLDDALSIARIASDFGLSWTKIRPLSFVELSSLENELYEVLPFKRALSWSSIFADSNSSYVCFRELLVGTARYGIHNVNASLDFAPSVTGTILDMKESILHKLEITPNEVDVRRLIMMVKTEGRGSVTNYDELFAAVEQYNINVSMIDPQEATRKEQVKLISEASIFMTPNGGISFNAMFLPPSAHIVVIGNGDSCIRDHALWAVLPNPVHCIPGSMDDMQPTQVQIHRWKECVSDIIKYMSR